MPGLLAACWKRGRLEQARELFAQARDAYTRLKGLPCTSEMEDGECLLARLPASSSPYPEIYRDPVSGVITAAAGWWYDPDTPEDRVPCLSDFAVCWRQEKHAVFDRLQGHYLILALEPREGELAASVDRLGVFPVYVARSDGIAWLSTSSLALAAALRPELDLQALAALFMDNLVRGPRTVFQSIRRLQIGEQVTFRDGRMNTSQHWSPFRKPGGYRKIEEAADDGIDLLRRACRRAQNVWPRHVCDLTSGLDSRMLLAAMAEPDIPISVSVHGDDDNIDVTVAKMIARRFGWPLEHMTRGPDWGQIRWNFFKRAVALGDGEWSGGVHDKLVRTKYHLKKMFDVSIGGGGGELFRDFIWQQEFLKIGRTSTLDIPRLIRYRFFLRPPADMSIFHGDWRSEYVADQVQTMERIVAAAPDALNTAKLDAIYLWKYAGSVGRAVGALYPVITTLHPPMTAALIEYALTVPWKFRIRSQLARQIITRAYPELAAMPTCYGSNAKPLSIRRPLQYFPHAVTAGKKLIRKFVHVAFGRTVFQPIQEPARPEWRRDLVSVLESERLLNPDNLRSAELYQADGLRRFLVSARAEDFSAFSQLSALLSVELICEHCGITPTRQKM